MKHVVEKSMSMVFAMVMALVMVVGFAVPAYASTGETYEVGDSFSVDGLEYVVIQQDDGSLALRLNYCTKNEETIIIPETVNGMPVVSIERIDSDNPASKTVFESNLDKVKKICIPDTVTHLGDYFSLIFVKEGTQETQWMSTTATYHCGDYCPLREFAEDADEIYVFESHTYGDDGICTVCGAKKPDNVPVKQPEKTSEGTTDKTPVVTNIKVSNITVSAVSGKIAAGKKVTLTADIAPANATNKAIKWSSSNTKVAKVSQRGVVTMGKKSAGKSVMITAKATDGSGVKATYRLKGMKGVVKKVTVSGAKTVKAGKSVKLKAKVTATLGANKKIKWVSSNKSLAKVSSSGKVTAAKTAKGKKVKITAMATDGSGKKKTVTIKIK